MAEVPRNTEFWSKHDWEAFAMFMFSRYHDMLLYAEELRSAANDAQFDFFDIKEMSDQLLKDVRKLRGTLYRGASLVQEKIPDYTHAFEDIDEFHEMVDMFVKNEEEKRKGERQ